MLPQRVIGVARKAGCHRHIRGYVGDNPTISVEGRGASGMGLNQTTKHGHCRRQDVNPPTQYGGLLRHFGMPRR